MTTTPQVLEGMDASRRVAWAKYFEVRELLAEVHGVILQADAFLHLQRYEWTHRLVHRLRIHGSDRYSLNGGASPAEREMYEDAAAAAVQLLEQGAWDDRGRYVGLGWPIGYRGRCA